VRSRMLRSFPMANPHAGFKLVVATVSLLTLLSAVRSVSAQSPQTFTSTGSAVSPAINISPTSLSSVNSTISVTNPNGTAVKSVSVTLNDVTTLGDLNSSTCTSPCLASSMLSAVFWLKAPNGTEFVLLGATGDGIDGNDQDTTTGSGLSGASITIEDSTSANAPFSGGSSNTFWTPQNGTFTVKPSSYTVQEFGAEPFSGALFPQMDGSATLNGTYGTGTTGAAGTWTLFVQNFQIPSPVSVANWSLTLNYQTVTSVATTTTVSTNAQPASLSNSVTLTADVTASGTTVNSGTVTFTATSTATGATTTTICSGVAVTNGTAQCTVGGSTLGQGTSNIEATYSPGAGFLASGGGLTQLVLGTTTHPSSDQWCNTASLSLPANGEPQAYPLVISVSGYAAGTTVSTVSVQLMNMSGAGGINGQYLLVAPGGQNLDFMDTAFTSTNASGVNLTIEDDAGQFPTGSPASGTYNPFDGSSPSSSDAFPSSSASTVDSSIPAIPGTINHPATFGSASETFASNFNGAPANGDWVLYATTNNATNAQTVGGGWCINLTPNTGVGTTTALTSSQNPATTNTSVTYTGTVKSGGNPVTSGGTVTFLDNDTTPGGTVGSGNVVPLNTTTGTATFSSSSLFYAVDLGTTNVNVFEGDHSMLAAYSGSSLDNPSQGSLIERLDNTTTTTVSGNSYNACNAGPVYSGQGNKGSALPNPSNIFVSNLPGTISTMGLTLENFFTSQADVIQDLESMVAGPNNKGLDFFSRTGGSNPSANTQGNYTFGDSAGSQVPQSSFGPGSYKPTSFGSTSSPDTYTSSISGFYNTPSSFSYASPGGTSTFASAFGNISPNGTWSLFFNMSVAQDAAGAANGWCLNFTENPVVVAVNEGHSGTGTGGDFVQGETGAQITTVITNNGPGSTGDPTTGGTNPLTLTDTLNSNLTYTGFTGSGWSCTAPPATAVTCKNDSAVAQGSTYPTLTLNVTVANGPPASISNSVNVSGAGVTPTSASDTIPVQASSVLAISKSHSGTFTQGSTGQWTLTVSNTASSGATSGTVNVTDTLPAGYTLASFTSTNNFWTCSGTSSITCTAIPGIAAGNSSAIVLTVNVPANSPTLVSNTADTWGGGDLTHTSAGTAAVSNTDTVSVTQVPVSIVLSSGGGQSTTIKTPFASPLIATVTDAGGVGVPNLTVTFTAPAGLTPTLKFSNSTNTISAVTSSSGQASSGTMTANGIPGGPYNVQVTEGSLSNNFQVTNLRETLTTIPTLSTTSATVDVFGFGFLPPGGQLALDNVTTGTPVTGSVTLNTASAQTSLTPMTSNSTGANTLPDWTVIGDVNGDGIPDLVTSTFQTDSVSVQLGNGDGTFGAANVILISAGFGPAETHLVSLRNNGVLDLIVGSFNTNQIAVLLGSGNGNFGTPTFYTSGTAKSWTSSFTWGDFNHDGNVDVAVANTIDNTVTIFLGNGSGTLAASGSPIDVGDNPEAIRAGDFTGSGFTDLVTANYKDGTVTTLLNDKNGLFTASTISVGSGVNSGPQALAIAGTGSSLRLAVANYKDNTVSVMTSNGSGGFGPQTIIPVGTGPDDVNFSDFNGDGIPDLVVTNYLSNNIDLLLGSSSGTYTLVGPFTVGTSPYSSAVGDLDLDGTPDIVTSNCFSNSTGTLLTGTQIVTSYTGLSIPAGDSVQATYTPSGGSSYGGSSSASSTALTVRGRPIKKLVEKKKE
jgi:FG-GAP-like repeat